MPTPAASWSRPAGRAAPRPGPPRGHGEGTAAGLAGAPALGALAASGEQVLAAAEATKWHTQSLAAFRSARGPLAVLDRGQVVFQRPALRAAPAPPHPPASRRP